MLFDGITRFPSKTRVIILLVSACQYQHQLKQNQLYLMISQHHMICITSYYNNIHIHDTCYNKNKHYVNMYAINQDKSYTYLHIPSYIKICCWYQACYLRAVATCPHHTHHLISLFAKNINLVNAATLFIQEMKQIETNVYRYGRRLFSILVIYLVCTAISFCINDDVNLSMTMAISILLTRSFNCYFRFLVYLCPNQDLLVPVQILLSGIEIINLVYFSCRR